MNTHMKISMFSSSPETLHKIATHLNLAPPLGDAQTTPLDHVLLLEVLVSRHERRQSQLEILNSTPLYPTERMLWDESVVPYDYKDGEGRVLSDLTCTLSLSLCC